MNLSHLHFNKQFIISQNNIKSPFFSHWSNKALKNKLTLKTHPELLVTQTNSEANQLTLLGSIINPEKPTDSNQLILNSMLSKTNSFDELESFFYSLGGRWVLIAQIGQQCRIYHDAAGLKPVFYTQTIDKTNIIASQPALLEKLGVTKKNKANIDTFNQYPNSQSWPLGVIPFDNVKQLLPNHFLDLNNLHAIRFWPRESIKPENINSVASAITSLLQGSISALCHRNKCSMSLTGGYDSRMLFSTSIKSCSNIDFFTVKSSFTPKYDIDIPNKIAQKSNINHQFSPLTKGSESDQAIINILSNNVGNMYYDRSMKNIVVYAKMIGSNTHLPGSVSEIGRCYYFPYGKRFSALNGNSLARYCGFKANPDAIKSFNKWLSTTPNHLGYEVLDLAYWEHRLGVWGACGLTFREGLIEQIPPMNNRKFMALCLSVPIKDRIAPHNLIRKIIKTNKPDLLNFTFNNEQEKSMLNKYPLLKRVNMILKYRFNRIFNFS
ncbi:hypothetical protein AADZ91_02025 [Colwelliaceae bacterium 6441]